MLNTNLIDDYFGWLIDIIECVDGNNQKMSENYKWILEKLWDRPFVWSVSDDANRAEDGLLLRDRFASEKGIELQFWYDILSPKCNCLEMMVALSIRIENEYLWDPDYGNRTGVWFWNMVENLGLLEYSTDEFNEENIDDILDRFINRNYSISGRGGLFLSANSSLDMRKLSIWAQKNCWFPMVSA